MSWDGTERRMKAQDHDTLIEVVQILKSHVENFDKHQVEDKKQFDILNRNMYLGIGILIAVKIVFKM